MFEYLHRYYAGRTAAAAFFVGLAIGFAMRG